MLPELTVRRTLEFYAAIRASGPLTSAEVEARAEEALYLVELDPRVWDSVIGDAEKRGISGGQRKRVSIAMELVSNPSLIFADEYGQRLECRSSILNVKKNSRRPTSGLDSTTSFQCMNALRNMASKGANVVAVIHCPSYQIFTSFTHVLILGVGGTTVYHDDPNRVLEYLTTPHPDGGAVFECPPLVNPADFVMDCVSGLAKPTNDDEKTKFPVGDRARAAVVLGDLWKRRSMGSAATYGMDFLTTRRGGAERLTTRETYNLRGRRSFVIQGWLFAQRAVIQQAQHVDELVYDCALMMAFGAIFGYQSERVQVSGLPLMILWIGIGIQLFLAVSMLPVFGSERLVFWREASKSSGMSLDVSAYFWAKDLVQLPRIFVLVLCFTVVFYATARPTPTFYLYFIAIFLAAYAASGYAYVLSVALQPKAAQLSTVVLALVLTILSGIAATRLTVMADTKGLAVVPWLSPIRWAGETLFVAQTRKLSHAWKMSSTFYSNPSRDSALGNLFFLGFHEGWLNRDSLERISIRRIGKSLAGLGDDDVCEIIGKWMWSDCWNLAVLFILGFYSRILALVLLLNLHRDKMGEPPLVVRATRTICFWRHDSDWTSSSKTKSDPEADESIESSEDEEDGKHGDELDDAAAVPTIPASLEIDVGTSAYI